MKAMKITASKWDEDIATTAIMVIGDPTSTDYGHHRR